MKFFVAFAALVCVAAATRPVYQRPAILPAVVEDFPAVGPVLVEHELQTPAFGPAFIDFPLNADGTVIGDFPAVGPALVEHEYETPAFGPALIDFPLNADGTVVSPVAAPPPVPEAASPLVQIIVNVAKPAEPKPEPHVFVPKPEGVDLSLLQPRH